MKAAIYDRTSLERGHPESQAFALRGFADSKDYTVVKEYTDKTSGGPRGEQDQFNEMMKDASRRAFDILLFWSWDRVTRRGPLVTLHLMAEFERMGIAYTSLQEPYLSSQADPMMRELMGSIISWVAKQERLRHSERMKAWARRRKQDGKPVGRPAGLKDKKPRVRRWRKRPAEVR